METDWFQIVKPHKKGVHKDEGPKYFLYAKYEGTSKSAPDFECKRKCQIFNMVFAQNSRRNIDDISIKISFNNISNKGLFIN